MIVRCALLVESALDAAVLHCDSQWAVVPAQLVG